MHQCAWWFIVTEVREWLWTLSLSNNGVINTIYIKCLNTKRYWGCRYDTETFLTFSTARFSCALFIGALYFFLSFSVFVFCTCATLAWAGSLHRLLLHASCQIAAVNNLLSDLFIWANSAGSLTPITLPVERPSWTASHCLALKSIPLQTRKTRPCASPLSSTSHGTLNMLHATRALYGDDAAVQHMHLP